MDVVEDRLRVLSEAFEEKYPGIGARLGGSQFVVRPVQEVSSVNLRPVLSVLGGAVALVLLIACANVANLLLVRGAVRRREIAVRASLGAGRGRLVRQLMTESLALWSVGAALGLWLGIAGIRALASLNPGVIPRAGENLANLQVDWRVAGFAALVTLLSGVAFGLLPAWLLSRASPGPMIKDDGSDQRGGRTRSALVVAQVAIALTLVIGCGLLIRTFIAMRAVDSGFDARNVLTMQITLTARKYESTAAVVELMRRTARRLEGIPGVEAAAAGCCLPVGTGAPNSSFRVAGREVGDDSAPRAMVPPTMPGYFRIARIPLIAGRTISELDDADSPRVAVVSQALAEEHWPNGGAVGSRIGIGEGSSPDAIQVVGVVGDVRFRGNGLPIPSIYLPFAQMPDEAMGYFTRWPQAWMARTRTAPGQLAERIRDVLQRESGLPVVALKPLDELLADSTAREDFSLALMLAFGGSALVLASVGVYGMMAYSVRLRHKEFGLRQAVGATPYDVRREILSRTTTLTGIGLAVGIAAALALADVMASFLFGVEARDPVVFVLAPVVLALAAGIAAWGPALRAGRIDPLEALRHE